MSDVILACRGVSKDYGALRPLRIRAFTLRAPERVAIVGLDGPAAETLVNLITGASLPDQGEIELLGRVTSTVTNADEWLAALGRIGIVSVRAILLDDLTLAQNIALTFTLSIDALAGPVITGVRRLAAEVGIPAERLHQRVADVGPDERARCHLAKALGLEPVVLICDHANAIAGDAAVAFGDRVRTVAKARGAGVLVLTADEAFARAAADRVFAVSAATGEVVDRSGWRRWIR